MPSRTPSTRRPASARRPATRTPPDRRPRARGSSPLAPPPPTIGKNGSYRRPNSGIAAWSNRRKLRLARTVGIALVLILILWQCGGGDPETTTKRDTATTTAVVTTMAPVAATTATATALPTKLPTKRSLAGAASAGARVLIAGGLDDTKSSSATLWSFDPTSGATDEAGRLPAALHTPALAALGTGTLVMGGAKGNGTFDDVHLIDAEGKLRTTGTLPQPRTNAAALTDGDGASVLLLGGWDGKSGTLEVLRTVDGATFTTVTTLLHPIRYPAVAMLGRSVWVIGGEWDKVLSSGIQRVDLDSGVVTDVAPLPVALSRASAFTRGGSLFVAGGRTPDGRSNQIYRIDPLTGVISAAGALPEPRSDAAVAVSGTTAYLFGGQTDGPTDTVVAITAQ